MNRFAIATRVQLILLIALTARPLALASPPASVDKPVKVEGIIDRVIGTGSEPVFRAGGYAFRILPATELRFGKGLQVLSEVGTNTWVTLEGEPDASGTIVATKASFAKLKLRKSKPAAQVTTFPPESKIDGYNGFATGPKAFPAEDHNIWCGWYDIANNPAVQEHIRGLGIRLVPQYQRGLPVDDPAKIPFRFYVVDEQQIRSAIFCANGLVLVPAEAVARLHNDDQLAAVLADGIAGELQLQAYEGRPYTWKDGAQLASGALGFAGPIPGAIGSTGGLLAFHKSGRATEHERGRMALAFTADAGLDPRQAPEAWRLLAPNRLPRDLAKLKEPELSHYLQNILETQYKPVLGETNSQAARQQ